MRVGSARQPRRVLSQPYTAPRSRPRALTPARSVSRAAIAAIAPPKACLSGQQTMSRSSLRSERSQELQELIECMLHVATPDGTNSVAALPLSDILQLP